MYNLDLPESEEFAPDVVNTLKNSPLHSAIRALLYSNNSKNTETFFRTFLDSTLIVLTNEAPISPENTILNYDEEGYVHYCKDTQVPLVQLNADIGTLVLPVFTESKYVHKVKGLNEFNGLAVSAPNLLEMSLIAQSSAICINPGNPEFLMLDRGLIEELVEDLKRTQKLPKEDLMTFHGHNI